MGELLTQTCENPECRREFTFVRKAGRPRRYCKQYCGNRVQRLRKSAASERRIDKVAMSGAERYARTIGYEKRDCPRCGRKKSSPDHGMYVEVSSDGKRGFAQCVSCGYSPSLTALGYSPPAYA